MSVNQIEVPDNYNEKDLIKTIIGLIQIQINSIRSKLIKLAGEQAKTLAEHQMKEKYENDIEYGSPWTGSTDIEEDFYYKSNKQLIKNYEDGLEYYEACRTYIEIYLIDRTHPKEKWEKIKKLLWDEEKTNDS